MTTEGSEDKDGLDREDDEALWQLLGRQMPPGRVSPYFARRVLRDMALAKRSPAGGAGWWGRLWSAEARTAFFRRAALWSGVFSGACALGLFCLSLGVGLPEHRTVRREEAMAVASHPSPSAGTTPPDAAPGEVVRSQEAEAVAVQEDEVIADLDNILEREESRLWTEDTARF